MVAAAKKAGRIVQVGFQRRQSPAIQQVRDYIQQGGPGRIIQVEAQINYRADLKDTTPQEPPASLDWELWYGPAPKLPYSPNIGHLAWRQDKEYGHGHLVDCRNSTDCGQPRRRASAQARSTETHSGHQCCRLYINGGLTPFGIRVRDGNRINSPR